MKLFKASQVREADAYTIANEPISSIDLMERAARRASDWIKKNISKNDNILVVLGSGNNGGDGLVVARHLLLAGFKVSVLNLMLSDNYSPDFITNKERWIELRNTSIQKWSKNIKFSDYSVIIDAILGSGLSRPIEGRLATIVKEINNTKAKRIAIDIPSGLFGEDNSKNRREHIIQADYTVSFQFPKLSFLLPENSSFVGKMHIIDIGIHPQYIEQTPTPFFFTQKEDIRTHFLDRERFSHKGTFGHALLFVGSKGKMGAAILASKACLRSGVGLLSVLIPKEENSIIQTALPEAMAISVENNEAIPDIKSFTTIGLGSGIGQSTWSLSVLSSILEQLQQASVFDADALNLLSANPELLNKVPKNSIFTPHPKELERLIGKSDNHYDRLFKTLELAKKYQIYVLIKGAFSTIVCPNEQFYFNSTGNPGMATAGSGDVLTGIITALLAQGLAPFEALQTGVYVHGLAGDIAKKEQTELSLIASDIIDNIGNAFKQLQV